MRPRGVGRLLVFARRAHGGYNARQCRLLSKCANYSDRLLERRRQNIGCSSQITKCLFVSEQLRGLASCSVEELKSMTSLEILKSPLANSDRKHELNFCNANFKLLLQNYLLIVHFFREVLQCARSTATLFAS